MSMRLAFISKEEKEQLWKEVGRMGGGHRDTGENDALECWLTLTLGACHLAQKPLSLEPHAS